MVLGFGNCHVSANSEEPGLSKQVIILAIPMGLVYTFIPERLIAPRLLQDKVF